MWWAGGIIIVELMGFWWLWRRYRIRRKRRVQSDHIRLEQDRYKTNKFHIDLQELRTQRNLAREMLELFQ